MKLITFLFSALTIIGFGQGLQCYSCYSPNCSDPFSATPTKVQTVTCLYGINYCGKQSITVYFEKRTFRDCLSDDSLNAWRNGNVVNVPGITYGKLYACDTNLCNGASSIKNAIVVALVSLVGLAYIVL